MDDSGVNKGFLRQVRFKTLHIKKNKPSNKYSLRVYLFNTRRGN